MSATESVAGERPHFPQIDLYRALVWINPGLDTAIADARRQLDRGDTAPLLGVPITVKDIIAVAGAPLTAGSRVLADHRAEIDAPVVARLRQAGAIVVGKTNTPEFAFGIGTANELHGATQNPWGAELSPGGSSGGEAVAVALRLSTIGVGTDFGGSIRWPAQSVGVLGLRPTPGRVPRTGALLGVGARGLDGQSTLAPDSLQGLVQATGFLARSVADLELALAVTCGPDGRDLLAAPVPLLCADVDLGGIDIAVSDGSGIGPVRDDVAAALDGLGRDLAAAGLRVTPLPNVFAGCREAYDGLRAYDDLADLRRLVAGREASLTAGLRRILGGARPDPALRSAAWEAALAARAGGQASLKTFPLVVLPVAPGPATGHDETMLVDGRLLEGFELMAHCRAVSLLGAPALSIPIARSTEGLPLSVQIVGAPWCEHQVFALARHIEQLRGGWQPPPGGFCHV